VFPTVPLWSSFFFLLTFTRSNTSFDSPIARESCSVGFSPGNFAIFPSAEFLCLILPCGSGGHARPLPFPPFRVEPFHPVSVARFESRPSVTNLETSPLYFPTACLVWHLTCCGSSPSVLATDSILPVSRLAGNLLCVAHVDAFSAYAV